jgi:hypothetical protein
MPEAWETSAAGPFMVMRRERGVVMVSALGKQNFEVVERGEDGESRTVVVGYAEAVALARKLLGVWERPRSCPQSFAPVAHVVIPARVLQTVLFAFLRGSVLFGSFPRLRLFTL